MLTTGYADFAVTTFRLTGGTAIAAVYLWHTPETNTFAVTA